MSEILTLPLINWFMLAYLCFLLTYCSFLDLLYYRIPNILVGCIIAAFPIWVLLTGNYAALSHVWPFVFILIGGILLFYFNLIGAGDIKLFAAVSLWLEWSQLLPLLIKMALYGGVLAILTLLFPKKIITLRKFLQNISLLKKINTFFLPDIEEATQESISDRSRKMVPYGIAISIATIEILMIQGIK